jgi:hypothetical protein
MIRWLSFNEESTDPWTGDMDSVHRAMDLFHTFFNRKIIHYFQKITGALDFYKKHP